MNKHVHRLVFDRRRGMRVPAAEHTRSAGKAAGGQTRAVAVAGAMSLLVSGAAQAQMARASTGTISAMGSSNNMSVSSTSTTRDMSATRSVASMVSQVLASGRPNLPVYSGAYKADDRGNFTIASNTDAKLMEVLQTSGAIIVNWDSFNLGKGYTLRFDMPAGGRALNKVRGVSGGTGPTTSLIDGVLEANGEVLIENSAGIIFGKNARVNTGSLVATALSIAQNAQGELKDMNDPKTLNLYQWRDGRAVFSGDDTSTAGFVATEPGAVIQALAGGKVIMVAPRVVNKGLIETPSGQTVLAAGQRVYLYDSTDTAQRGLLVAVDNFTDATLASLQGNVNKARINGETELNTDSTLLGTVENVREGGAFTSGLVRADKGTINLVGAAIRQKGQLTATTAVKAQNGGIYLQAMKDTYVEQGLAKVRKAKTLGEVVLGEGSITEVLPSTDGLLNHTGDGLASQIVDGTVQGDELVTSVAINRIGVDRRKVIDEATGALVDEVLRVPATLAEPTRPTVPAEDATEAVKAKYQADLAQYAKDKVAYEQSELTVQTSSNTFYRSRIDVLGQDITLGAGARLQAPGGEINVLAAKDWETSPLRTNENLPVVADGSRIVAEAGVVVDVSGLDNLRLPSQRNQLSAQLFSIELADSPVQRAGVVYRQTVMANAQRFLDIGDVNGYYNNLRYTAAEMSTTAGLIRMQSQGALLLDPAARLDFSGGAISYDGGTLVTSVFLRDGLITLAENARRDVRYDTFISDASKTSADELARYGLSGLSLPAPSLLPEQFVGKSAGAALLAAPVMSLGAELDGSVRMSEVQRKSAVQAGRDPGLSPMLTEDPNKSPLWRGLDDLKADAHTVRLSHVLTKDSTEADKDVYQPQLFASLRPTAGLLVLGLEMGIDTSTRAVASLVSGVRFTGLAQAVPRISAGLSSDAFSTLLAQVGNTAVVSSEQLQRAGLGGLSVFADRIDYGNVATQDAPSLQLAAGDARDARSGFTAKARLGDVVLNGRLVAPGGTIDVSAQSGNVVLTSGSRLDAGGTRRDDRVAGSQAVAPALAGGKITLKALDGVTLAQGSEVDVSGAAWRSTDGSLTRGRAGELTLQVNTSSTKLVPDGQLTLAGTITGFDFSGGGKLTLRGLPSLVLGGEKAGAFQLDSGLYASRGFGTLDAEALGHVDVLATAEIKPKLVNMKAVSTAYGAVTGETYTLDTLTEGLRSGNHLTLTAKAEANVVVENGLVEGANLTVAEGADLNTGLGGSITLKAGGNIAMGGTLRALGGQVSLALTGKRGGTTDSDFEKFGWVKGQSIVLGGESVIDVSGAIKAIEVPNAIAQLQGLPMPKVGEVLAGGTVTLGGVDGKAVRGTLLALPGSKILLNGETGQLSRDISGAPTRISSAAGTLHIMSTDGFSLLGTVQANAPDASVAGGTLNIALSREGTADVIPSGGKAYPAGPTAGKRTIRITDGQKSAEHVSSDKRLFGEGVVSADLLNNSGFDRVQLRADEAIQLNAGVSIKAGEERTRLQSVVLDAPLLEVTKQFKTTTKTVVNEKTQEPEQVYDFMDEPASTAPKASPDHLIQAHQVAMGPITRYNAITDNFKNTVPASQRTLAGDRWLSVQAGLIELNGNTAVQGTQRVDLSATLGRSANTSLDRRNGEVRFIGQRPFSAPLNGDRSLSGQFNFQGQLNLTAGQVYATTLSNFSLKGAPGSTLNVLAPVGGSTSQTPLSALATLKLDAANVNLDGVIRQPLGSIDVTATTLSLGDQAALSVSADGMAVPVGMTVNKAQWVYSPQGKVAGDIAAADNVVQDITQLPITKQIKLDGTTLSLSTTSMLEAQAGGDILAWQFNPGVGGSTDTYLRKGVFAVLPSYGFDFAPFDADIRARTKEIGTDLKAGDQVTIATANDVLAAGTYTLLDPRYGILPGAVLLSTTTLDVNRPMPEAIQKDDGSVTVSGHRTATGTTQNGGNDQRLALVLEPEAAFRAKSDISVVSGNDFQRERATKSGNTLSLAGDAGLISLSADNAFNWRARFNLKGMDDLKAGSFDLAMPDIEVRSALPPTSTAAGVVGSKAPGVVGLDALNALGAESVMLGGIRTLSTNSDGSVTVNVDRKASKVSFKADGDTNTLSTAGEIWAVASDSVNVDAGVTIASTGQDTGAARTFKVKGNGALLQVGHLANTTVESTETTATRQAKLKVGGTDQMAAAATLRGNAVQLDSTGTTQLAENTVLDSQSLGLGAASVVVGDVDAPAANALQIKGSLLDKANQAQRLNLRANSGSMDFAAGTQLGGQATQKITLNAPQIKDVVARGSTKEAAAEAVTQVTAQEVVLSNSSGQAAPLTDTKAQDGVGTLVVKAVPVLRDGHTGGITVAASGTTGQRLAFATTTLQSQGDIVFSGKGTTTAQGNLNLSAARVTASSDADQQVTAGNDLTIGKAAGSKTLNETLGAGGKLGLEGRVLTQGGNIDIEAGRLNLVARGGVDADNKALTETLKFEAKSNTSVAGRVRQVSDTYAVASGGGTLKATAKQGAIVVDGTLSAAAPTLPKGSAGDAPGAGIIELMATGANGEVKMGQQGKLDLAGAAGKGGTVKVDTRKLALTEDAQKAAAAAAALAQNGLDQLVAASRKADGLAMSEFNVRQREGDLTLNSEVKAALVALTADGANSTTGSLILGAKAVIDATTESGGVVQLQAKNDLTLNDDAKIEARSTRDGANGGDVLLASSAGTVRLGQVTVVADSVGDKADGRIVIRAEQTRDAKGIYTGGMKVEAIDSAKPATLTAGRVQLAGVRVYSDPAKNSLRSNNASAADAASGWALTGVNGLNTDATNFATSANQTAILAKAGLSNTSNAGVRAEAEIRFTDASKAFTISNDLQMNAAAGTAGAQPMNLTVRAAGDLNVNGSVSAGLSPEGTSAAAAIKVNYATASVQNGEAASLRFVAGADTDSANVNATQADASKGHFTLASGKLIRTTTGSIDAHSSGDVRLMSASNNAASSIYVTGGVSKLSDNELLALQYEDLITKKITLNLGTGTTGAYPEASNLFTHRGGRLTVSAGGEVGGFVSVTSDKDTGVVTKSRQQLLQGTANYFVHGGSSGSKFQPDNAPLAWFTRFNDFRQGLGSFGGGNIDVRAGTDVSNMPVVSPTSARMVLTKGADGQYWPSTLKEENGGDVSVRAGQDIKGGLFFLGRGAGTLSAGGGLLSGEDKQVDANNKPLAVPQGDKLIAPTALLAVMDGLWSVQAVGDVNIGHVFNPTALPFLAVSSGGGLTAVRSSLYYTYSDAAGLVVNALKGKVTLAPDDSNFKLLLTNSPTQKLNKGIEQDNLAASMATVLPPTMNLVSLQGDVTIDRAGQYSNATFATNGTTGSPLFLMPSLSSDVNVYAGRDLTIQANLQMLDSSQLVIGLPTLASPAALPTSATSSITLGSRLKVDTTSEFRYANPQTGLLTSPITDLSQAANERMVHVQAGRDVVFTEINDSFGKQNRSLQSYLRSNRPTEIVAGRDIVNPHFLGQNFDEADVTRVSAGRDIIGVPVVANAKERALALGGPGAFLLEAGRDLGLNQLNGVFALGNLVNSALPDASAKITVAAGTAKTVNLPELLARHGSNLGLRAAVNKALVSSGVSPSGVSNWADLSDEQALAAFGQLTPAHQAEAVQTFLDASFASLYMPEFAGASAATYASSEFQRKKQEAMWAQILQTAGAAGAIKVSTDPAEEASRKLRRQALFAQAQAVADLAGFGQSFNSKGDVNLGQSRVFNLGQGGGSTLGSIDNSQGGIDVLASGQVLAGLPTRSNDKTGPNGSPGPGGFINFQGGSFRSLSLGDFLAGDQKVISLGRGNLLIYSVRGSIDSGKGSNTSLSADVPSRVFNQLTGRVESKGSPPSSGSGFQKLQTPADVTPVFGLYAPNGEIRALDAFIKGDAAVDIVTPTVKGGDNIGGASGVASAPAPTVSISLTPKLADPAAGVAQANQEADSKAKAQANSVLTVDLLGFGEGPATAAGTAETPAEKDKAKDKDKP
jgi:filamentous hemagglutinin